MYTYTTHALKNGTRVVLVPQHETAAVTVLALYEVGSRYETAKLSGASHFIEHMMFKGTSRRPESIDITRDLDAVGADYNAFTSKDYTEYYVRLQADKLPLAVDILDDMLHCSLYRAKDVDSERNVIIEEINMYNDNPIKTVDDLIEETLFGPKTPLGRNIAGTAETIRGIGRKELVAFRDRYYVPERTVLAVAGRFDETEAMALLEKTFGKAKARGKAALTPFQPFSLAKAGYRSPRSSVKTKDTDQVQAAIAFPSVGLGDKKLQAVTLRATVLGVGMSSRLFTSVREKRGLAYSVYAANHSFQDVGIFTVQAGLSKAKIHQALALIMRELAHISKALVTEEELSRAREQLKGRMVLSFEDSSHLADRFAKQELLQRRIESPEKRLEKLFAVTREEIRDAARLLFRPERTSIAVIGPFDPKKEDFARHASLLV